MTVLHWMWFASGARGAGVSRHAVTLLGGTGRGELFGLDAPPELLSVKNNSAGCVVEIRPYRDQY